MDLLDAVRRSAVEMRADGVVGWPNLQDMVAEALDRGKTLSDLVREWQLAIANARDNSEDPHRFLRLSGAHDALLAYRLGGQ